LRLTTDIRYVYSFLHASSLAAIIPASVSESVSPADQSTSEIKEILVSACELANARAAKVLVARTPQHADLSLEEFVAVFEQAWTFVVACEAISGRMIVSLRGVITSQVRCVYGQGVTEYGLNCGSKQARAFLVKYHSIRLQASAKCVEEEQWVQIDVPPSTQKCVDTIIASAISDMPEHRLSSKMTNGHVEPSANGTGDEAGAKVLNIEDNTFFVVSATAKTVEMLNDYQRLMVNLPLVATDVMNRIIEFLKVSVLL
jgi:vacuolar protein sorting-associated protein 54